MRIAISNEVYGEIVYEESPWTGKKALSVGGKSLAKLSKNEFATEDGGTARILGNYLMGTRVVIGNETIELTPSVKWYEIALALLPFIVNLIWGNVVALVEIVPVVGGAIGGVLSALVAFASLLLMKRARQTWLKILIGIGMLCVGFLLCFLVGFAIVSAVRS